MNHQALDISYVRRKLVIEHLLRTMLPIFSLFLVFWFFTRLKVREISLQNMKNLENIGHIVLIFMHISHSLFFFNLFT